MAKAGKGIKSARRKIERTIREALFGPLGLQKEERTKKRVGASNIVGVAEGKKVVKGEITDRDAVTLLVVKKRPKDKVDPDFLLPAEIEEVETDVVEIGDVVALPADELEEEKEEEVATTYPCPVVPRLLSVPTFFTAREKSHPLMGGISCSPRGAKFVGTLGCVTRLQKIRGTFLLSNRHVLVEEPPRRGAGIVVPGNAEPNKKHLPVEVGRLWKWSPIHFFVPGRARPPQSLADAALAMIYPAEELAPHTLNLFGRISSLKEVAVKEVNEVITKVGRTTGITYGATFLKNATLRVRYDRNKIALFRGQEVAISLSTWPFSAPGDSGSLVFCPKSRRVVGLLFAGSRYYTVYTPIQLVEQALGVKFS